MRSPTFGDYLRRKRRVWLVPLAVILVLFGVIVLIYELGFMGGVADRLRPP